MLALFVADEGVFPVLLFFFRCGERGVYSGWADEWINPPVRCLLIDFSPFMAGDYMIVTGEATL